MKNHKQVVGMSGCKVVRRGYLSGQSLIEVIVSVSIAVIVAIALISMSIITGRAARAAKNNTQATKLAEEYMEQVRIFRDRNGFSAIVNGCYKIDTSLTESTWLQQPCPQTITLDTTVFTRKVDITDVIVDKKLIVVTVNWTDQGGVQSVVQQTYLTRWDVF